MEVIVKDRKGTHSRFILLVSPEGFWDVYKINFTVVTVGWLDQVYGQRHRRGPCDGFDDHCKLFTTYVATVVGNKIW